MRPFRAVAWLVGLAVVAPQVQLRITPPGAQSGGTSGLLQSSNFTLVGGFRIPAGADDQHSAHFAGNFPAPGAIWYDPNGNSGAGSLLIAGCQCPGAVANLMAEVSIPTLVNSSTVSSLNTATLLTGWTDPAGGRSNSSPNGISGSTENFIAGIYDCKATLCASEQLLVNYVEGYGSDQVATTFVASRSTLAYVSGPYSIGQGNAPTIGGDGWTAGGMTDIPSTYQTALGGKIFSSLCCVSIISRTSLGPPLTAFDPSTITSNPVGNLDLGYDINHATLGPYTSSGTIYSQGNFFPGVVFATNSPVVLAFGTGNNRAVCIPNPSYPSPPANGCNPLTGPAYGISTTNSALDNTTDCPCPPGDSAHDLYYDPDVPAGSGPGPTMYPHTNNVLAFKESDLAAVFSGTQQYYVPVPYATWTFNLPVNTGTPPDCGHAQCLIGAAWAATGTPGGASCPCVFIEQFGTDSSVGPLIWVYNVSTPPAPSPVPDPIDFFRKLWGTR